MHPWRERLSRWFSPIARVVPLSPNAITLTALALNLIGAALLAAAGPRPALFLIAIVPIIAAGFADAFDGIVARAQQKESRFGDFLDHLCDRISDSALAACWLIGSGVRESLVVVATIVVMLNGYTGTQIEATFHTRNYESIGRGEFVLALVTLPIVSFILFSNGWAAQSYGGATALEWMSLLLLLAGLLGMLQRIGVARRLERP